MKIYNLVFFLIFNCFAAYSQTPHFEHLDVSDGLSQNTILSIDIDKTGNVWVGTRNGLNRYNGYTFKTYKPNNNNTSSLIGNEMVSIKADKNDNIWVYTSNGGLNKYDKGRKTFSFINDSIFIRYVSSGLSELCIENENLIWVANLNEIKVYDNKTKINTTSRGLSKITDICNNISENGIICSGYNGIFSFVYSNDSIAITQIISEPTYQIITHKNSYVAITDKHILQYNSSFSIRDTLLIFNKTTSPSNSKNITSLCITEQFLLIGATDGLYLFKHDKRNEPYEFISHSLKGKFITEIVEDQLGNIWIGTDKFGMYLYSNSINQFKYIHPNTSSNDIINNESINAICETKNEDLWISSLNNVTVLKANNTIKRYQTYINEKGETKDINISHSILEDSKGNIWISSSESTCIYNKKRDRIESTKFKYGWSWPYACYSIKELTPGIVTITGADLIGEIDLETGKLNILSKNKNGVYLWKVIRDIEIDCDSNLWIVQNYYGLVKINKERTQYTRLLKDNYGFSDNKIYSIKIAGDTIWLATNAGLNLFSLKANKVIKKYFEEDGLSNNIVLSVTIDSNNNLWMNTAKGISCFNPKTEQFTTYLHNTIFNEDANLFINNTIYYGNNENIIYFNPYEIENIKCSPQPVISNFYLFNKLIKVDDTVNNKILLKQALPNTKTIELKYFENSFSIAFNAFPYDYPNNNSFKYRLKGLNNEWFYPTNGSRMATYTSIPPGNYHFELMASNNNTEWSNSASIEIKIIPPFWQTIWFKISGIIFLLITTIAFIQYRISIIKKQKLLLENRVHEQTKELKEQAEELIDKAEELKEQNSLLHKQKEQIEDISQKLHEADQSKLRVFTNISHEFRTPITLILGHLENIKTEKYEQSKSIIRRNAQRLLDLINQLIEIRKVDQGKLELNIYKIDIIEFTQNIVNSFKLIANKKDIHLQFYSEFTELEVWLDSDKTEKIIYNLITNAIKYTLPNNDILVTIKATKSEIIILVEDHGIGISDEDIEHVFDRFYRAKENTEVGHGIGLSLTKGLVEVMQGKIFVTSEIGKGSCFCVSFKKGKEHYKDSEINEKTYSKNINYYTYVEKAKPIKNNVGYKILLVDDNIELSNYIVSILQDHFIVKTALNGQEGIDVMKNFIPDLIISDIMMPVMDGIKFCKTVKANIETSHIPFILLTAKTGSESKIEGFTLGIDDYIEKPFNHEVLLARVNTLLLNREKFKKRIMSFDKAESIEKNSFNKRDKEFWNKVNDIIENNYPDSNFNAERLSELMNMSRATFYRKFKTFTGLNAAEHIRKYRLHKAIEHINEGEKDITLLGINVGFKSASQFRNNFKEEFDTTPSNYAKEK